MDNADIVIVGAGVVGLAVARALQRGGRDVILIEKNSKFGMETSSRNSEVIHAGIYYDTDTFKAKFCVRGNSLLYDFCNKYNVPHRRCGKLIVATQHIQESKLHRLLQQARANGVDDLEMLSREQISKLEPDIVADFALLSPSTGIIDSHSFMLSMLGDFENHGGTYIPSCRFLRGELLDDNVRINLDTDEKYYLACKLLINAAGNYSIDVANSVIGAYPNIIRQYTFAKGQYFSYSGKSNIKRHIYPLPENGGLGIHVTVDIAGNIKCGPDITWGVQRDDFSVDETNRKYFFENVRKYWPNIQELSLHPGYAGIRPKLNIIGEAAADFNIDFVYGRSAGVVSLFGIESPGLTSSLAIAEYVSNEITGHA